MYCDSVCSGKKNPKWSIKHKILVGFGSCLYHIIIHHILTILTSIHLNGTNLEDFDLFCFHTLLFCFMLSVNIILVLFVVSASDQTISQQQQPASLLSLCQSIPSSLKCCLSERQMTANKLHKTTSVKSKTRMMVVITNVSSDGLDSCG